MLKRSGLSIKHIFKICTQLKFPRPFFYYSHSRLRMHYCVVAFCKRFAFESKAARTADVRRTAIVSYHIDFYLAPGVQVRTEKSLLPSLNRSMEKWQLQKRF